MNKLNHKRASVQTATLTDAQLKTHIENLFTDSCYYFLRYPDDVSGIKKGKPTEFPLEGQVFDAKTELRWKKKGHQYQVLLLSTEDKNLEGFTPLGKNWESKAYDALIYPETETRLPKSVKVPENINIGQRYFRNPDTATIHFIALTVK